MDSFKYFLQLLFLIILNFANAQEELISDNIDLKQFSSTQMLPIVDTNNNIHLFLYSQNILDDTGLTQITYDPIAKTLTKKEKVIPITQSRKNIVGFQIDTSNAINLFYKRKGEFNRFIIKSGKVTKQEDLELKLKKEKIIQYINYQNNFYMLTVERSGSTIHHYTFKGNTFEKKSFDFNKERFYDKKNQLTNLDKLLSFNSISTIVDPSNYKPIQYTRYAKIYPKEGELTITLDRQTAGTRTLHLNLINGKGIADFYPISVSSFSTNDFPRSNSFKSGDVLFSMITSKSKMILSATNFNNKKKISEHLFTSKQEMIFKTTSEDNTVDRIQENTTKEKIKASKKFLKTLANAHYIGLSAEKISGKTILSVGAYSPPSGGGAVMSAPGPSSTINTSQGPVTIAGAPATTNFTTSAYAGYSLDRKTVLSDDLFQPTNEEIPNAINSRISKFREQLKKSSLHRLFKYGNGHVLGYYSKKDKVYHLVKFEE